MPKLVLLPRPQATAAIFDRATRITFKAMLLRDQFNAICNELFDGGYFVAQVDGEVSTILWQKFETGNNPVVGSVLIFRPEYAEDFLKANTALPADLAKALVDGLYATNYMFGFLGESVREKLVEALKANPMELVLKQESNTVNTAVGDSECSQVQNS